jgi:upstream stimulatory factor
MIEIDLCLLSVERRRRDKINNWIVSLSQIIPDCTLDSTKTGAVRPHPCPAMVDFLRGSPL